MFFLIKSINGTIGRLRSIDEKINEVLQHLLQNKTPFLQTTSLLGMSHPPINLQHKLKVSF
jgi:hypothetical protein